MEVFPYKQGNKCIHETSRKDDMPSYLPNLIDMQLMSFNMYFTLYVIITLCVSDCLISRFVLQFSKSFWSNGHNIESKFCVTDIH